MDTSAERQDVPSQVGRSSFANLDGSMIGQEFGHYRIVEYLGRGGMGTVYKALDGRLQRPVAVKFLHESWVSDPNARKRFEREARTASGLSHPNICVIHDFGESNGQHYIVMEWLDGSTLERHLTSREPGVDEILQWSIELSGAVNYAHAHGVIHRDLKPANIFVTQSGQVKILDFGLAKPIDPETGLSSDTGTTAANVELTNPGSALGTVGYMSPEQARGEQIDGRSDVFSLGAVMYEMVARRRAFAGETNALVYDSILNRTPSRVRQFNPNVPVELDDIIIKKALEKDPSLRYQTSAELHADLRRLKRDLALGSTSSSPIAIESPPSPPPPAASISRRQFAFFGGGMIAGLVLAGIISLLTGGQNVSRVAVLPFANTVEDEATGYLAARITESVRNDLLEQPGLFVYPSVFVSEFEGPNYDLDLIRRELDANFVVTGVVSPRPEGSSIQVDLIDVRSLSGVWGQAYDFLDPLSVQESIPDDIAENLRVRLSGEETAEIEISRLLREARSRFERRSESELLQAIDLFEAVIERDPQRAEAFAGLALVQAVLPIYSQVNPDEYARLAKYNAEQSLGLGGQLADAHNALALVAVNFDHDWDEAETHYGTAIGLDPDNATTHQWRAEYFAAVGEFESALAELDAAINADPLSLVIPSVRGWVLHCADRPQEAIDQLRSVLDRSPDFGLAHRFLGQAYLQTGDYEQALQNLLRAEELGAGRRADIAYARALMGDRDEALRTLESLAERSASPYELAIAYAGLGDNDAAFAALEQGIDEGAWELVNVNVEPQFAPIRSDPRFADILFRLGL